MIYGHIVLTVWIILGLVSVCYISFRVIRALKAYARGDVMDEFDDSCIPEAGLTLGTNFFGILIDTLILLIVTLLAGFTWAVSTPIFLIILFVRYSRKKALHEQSIIDKLTGT